VLRGEAARDHEIRLLGFADFGAQACGGTPAADAVRRYAQGWAIREGERHAEAFVPLTFA